MVDITAATDAQFDTFLSTYGHTVDVADRPRLLALSLAFLNTVDICTAGDTYEAQCWIAYAMSSAGGGFNPAAVADDRILTKKGLGRNAIVKEWEVNSQLSGTESATLLKRVPMAYGLLKPLLCASALQSATGSISNFDVIR